MFRSWWQAGFEGADHVNSHGRPLHPNDINGHQACVDEDYAGLAPFGIRTVRESVGWRICTAGGAPDFTPLNGRLESAARRGLQVVWTICHYGMPAGTDVLDPGFPARFAEFAHAAASHVRQFERGAIYVLINEPSFFTWALANSNLMGEWPRLRGRGDDVKRQLMAAIISGAEAVRDADPKARFLHVDPVIHVGSSKGDPESRAGAERERASQFPAWDMAMGFAEPQLRGSPSLVDCIGVNYYHSNQWEYGLNEPYFWHLKDPRRISFSSLLMEMWDRYRRPLLVAETSHVGVGRAEWIGEIVTEVDRACAAGVDVRGICLYPYMDRVDWQDDTHWHRSGLWDVVPKSDGTPARQLDCFYARRLLRLQGRPVESAATRALHPGIDRAIVAFCPLPWADAPLRVRSVMSRLAAFRTILFVDAPGNDADEPWLEETNPYPGVHVLTPHLRAGSADERAAETSHLMARHLAEDPVRVEVVWLYEPIARELAAQWPDAMIVREPAGMAIDTRAAHVEQPEFPVAAGDGRA